MRGSRRALSALVSAAIAVSLVEPSAHADADPPLRAGAEAAFVQLDPIDYEFVVRKKGSADVTVPFTTSESRIFYTLQPADTNADSAPLFVFLNGGPGAATTANFFANNTAPYTLNLAAVGDDPAHVVKNPDSWTSIANLLYIDPSQSGFSYNTSKAVFLTTDFPSVLRQLWEEYWDRGNFNPFIDADQILRVILTFLETHPQFKDREVVMVGESYGGIRVSMILHMLMNSGLYDTGGDGFFHDPGLAQMIRGHFGTSLAPTVEQVTSQFDQQILVQPQLSSYQEEEQGKLYWDEDPSVIDKVAKDSHTWPGFTRWWPYCARSIPPMLTKSRCAIMRYIPRFGRDRYDYAQPKDYSDKQDAYTNEFMRSVSVLKKMLGVDPATIQGLQPSQRGDAYHTMGFPYPGDDQAPSNDTDTLVGRFGTLDAPDSYYVAWNKYAYAASAVNLESYVRKNLPLSPDEDPIFGDMFLSNLRYVRTFLTNAKRDLVIFSEAMAPSLKRHSGLVKDVQAIEENALSDGHMDVEFSDGVSRGVTWPTYAEAGHAVAMTMPGKLLADVREWLRQSAPGAADATEVRWSGGQRRIRGRHVHVRLVKPASGGRTWTFPATGGAQLRLRGRLVMRHQGQRVVVRELRARGSHITARVGNSRVRLLTLAGLRHGKSTVRLTERAARILNDRLDATVFDGGQVMGRIQ